MPEMWTEFFLPAAAIALVGAILVLLCKYFITRGLARNTRRQRVVRMVVRSMIVVLVLCGVLGLLRFEAYRDWTYMCKNTASCRGHRVWFFGRETGHWYEESPIETFMRAKHPDELEHRWTSGDPGQILYFRRDYNCAHVLPDYVAGLTDEEKRQLYHVFASGDRKRIQAKVREIFDLYFEKRKRSD